MIVQCSGCDTRYKIADEKLNHSVKHFSCKKCGTPVTIPSAEQAGISSSTGDDQVSEGKRKIVVADDTAFFRIMLTDLLEGNGYEVITANDGEEALQKVKHELPDLDLLLLDMLMPKMDGFTVIKELKKGVMGQALPILALSGVFKSDDDREMMRDLGVVGYIDKDTSPDEILRRVKLIFGEE